MPIYCCNVIYKVIFKILATRLKPLIPHLVGENQSAFVEGRTIQNNIFLTHELAKNYTWKGGPKCFAIKVDIMKAFDSLSWSCLMMILESMTFLQKYLSWIKLCIPTFSFFINLSGALNGNFNALRGFRQGDPLSLSLFILIMEGFT